MHKINLMAGLLASFALCITVVGGGGADVQQETRTTTTGKERLSHDDPQPQVAETAVS